MKEIKKGVKVRVKRNIKLGWHGNEGVVPDMLNYAGKVLTVSGKCWREGVFYVLENQWSWTLKMCTKWRG